MKLALNNGKVFIKGKLEKTNILIENNSIIDISKNAFKAEHEMDCKNKLILPGAIDCHVHFRTPGAEYKEDFFSGSLAAIHGGVTTVMDMPNTLPRTATKLAFDKKKELAKESFVNIDFFMAVSPTNHKEIEKTKPRALKLYFGSTTGSTAMNEPKEVEKIFKLAKKLKIPVTIHAEDEEIIEENSEKYRMEKNPNTHVKVRSEIAETKAIEEVLEIQKKIGNKIHIAHVSTKKSLELIAKAKKRKNGKEITCETTPNYLFLDSSDYKNLKNLMKCNPSIKGPKDKEALMKGLINRTIDIVATDHAPHSFEEKKKEYWDAPSGIPGVETMVPLLLDAVNRKEITLKTFVEAVSEKPAEIYSWTKKGKIEKGFDADLIIVDMEKEYRILNEKLFTKARYSPFNKKKLKGFIEQTIIGGQIYG